MKEKPECHLCEQKILYLEPGMRHTECRLGCSLTEGKCVKTKDVKTNDMEKTIEIPEGYEARIEGNKVVLVQNDEKIRSFLYEFIKVCGWSEKQFPPRKRVLAYLEKQKEQQHAEWSEEDKKMIDDIIYCLPRMAMGNIEMLPSVAEQYAQRLKSLRPQPHWKPSEEQMGALNYAYCELFKRGDVGDNILGSLQNLIDTLRNL